jgi:uncharacterized membrane protein
MKETYKSAIVAAIAAIFAVKPFMGIRFFYSHDTFFHLDRLILFDNALREGCFYPRWIQELAHGYGMPLFNYYSPFTYYFAEVFHILGVDFPEAIVATFIAGFVLSGIAMFLFAREILGEAPAIVAAVAYIYAPYHLLDAYVRGALPEFLTFIFLPLVFYSILKANSRAEYYPLISLSYALLILTHNIPAFISTPFIFLFVLLQKERLKITAFLLLGLGLSAFYWLPAIAEFRYLYPNPTFNYADHFVYFSQLFEKRWGFGLSVPGPGDGMSFQIGDIHVIFSMLALYLLYKGNKNLKRYIAYFTSTLLISIFFSLHQSKILWDIIPFFDFVLFPWRFLLIASFAASFLSAAFLTIFRGRREIKVFALLSGIIFIIYSMPVLFILPVQDEKLALYNYQYVKKIGPKTTVGENELLPRWVSNYSELRQRDRIPWPFDVAPVGCNRYYMEGNFTQAQNITLPIFYFPGWEVEINGAKAMLYPDKSGLITFYVPEGYNRIYISFEDTLIRRLAKIISIFSAFALVGYLLKKRILNKFMSISGP